MKKISYLTLGLFIVICMVPALDAIAVNPSEEPADVIYYSLDDALNSPLSSKTLFLWNKHQRCDPFYMCHYSVPRIPHEIAKFVNLQKLEILYLLRAPEEEDSIRLSPIFNLTNLIELNLTGNIISDIPSEIAKLTNLQKLNLSHNNIKTIAPEMAQLKNLTELDLSFNYYGYAEPKILPPELFRLINLKTLNLSNFSYHEKALQLPPEIGNLRNLVALDLSNNYFTNLPLEIGNLKNLRKLNLESCCGYESNGLKEFLATSTIGKLRNLEELNLSRNRLEKIPSVLWKLKNLKKLNLSYTDISTLPSEIETLISLTELDLRGNNKLKELPIVISKLKNLDRLRLSSCHLLTKPLDKIEHIDLYLDDIPNSRDMQLINKYKNVSINISLDLSNFEYTEKPDNLDSYMRRLKTLPPELLASNKLIGLSIYLSWNNLKTLPPELLELNILEELDLSSNHYDFTLPHEISELSNLKILRLTLGAAGGGSAKPSYPYSEIAKLRGLNLKELHLLEYSRVVIDIDLINKLLPNTIIERFRKTGANIEERPKSANVAINEDLLKTIEILLDKNPKIDITKDEFLKNEVEKDIRTIEQQIIYRTQFRNFLLEKLNE